MTLLVLDGMKSATPEKSDLKIDAEESLREALQFIYSSDEIETEGATKDYDLGVHTATERQKKAGMKPKLSFPYIVAHILAQIVALHIPFVYKLTRLTTILVGKLCM